MSKKKLRMMAWAIAVVLAFVPFLHGCVSNTNQNAGSSTSDQQAEGSLSQAVHYGQISSINGDQVTVVMGGLDDVKDGGGKKTFTAGGDEIVFNRNDVSMVDATGAIVEAGWLLPDDLIAMTGAGEGVAFVPRKIEVLDIAVAGVVADDARIPQGL